MTGITALPATGHSFPITTYIPPSNIQQHGGNKNASVQSSYSVQAMPGGAFTTIFAPGTSVQLGQQLTQGQQQGSTVQVRTSYINDVADLDSQNALAIMNKAVQFGQLKFPCEKRKLRHLYHLLLGIPLLKFFLTTLANAMELYPPHFLHKT